MSINKENLVYRRIVVNNTVYMILHPITMEEFIYGLENDLLTINDKTKINEEPDIFEGMIHRIN